jgi:tetratricopeptide (TPR) repeat protein
MTPWFDKVRFGRWEELAGKPNPAPDLPYATAIWHYAEGMAALRLGRKGEAASHLAALQKVVADPKLLQLTVFGRYPMSNAARIAERTLAAEIEADAGRYPQAIAALHEAEKIEDGTPYDEPPAWHAPVRQTLGAVLLAAGKPAEAETAYREELRRNPDNGWSLFGLAQALRAQHRETEAKAADQAFAAAWKDADVKLASSRF